MLFSRRPPLLAGYEAVSGSMRCARRRLQVVPCRPESAVTRQKVNVGSVEHRRDIGPSVS